jgi:hypothetical protein
MIGTAKPAKVSSSHRTLDIVLINLHATNDRLHSIDNNEGYLLLFAMMKCDCDFGNITYGTLLNLTHHREARISNISRSQTIDPTCTRNLRM